MGIFGAKNPKAITDNKFTWKNNVIEITEDGYLLTSGIIGIVGIVRIPVRHIETVTYTMNPLKPSIDIDINLIGKGVVFGKIIVGMDLTDEVQDWLLERIEE
ncbi:hypothetical protein BHU24_18635 [Bacillus pseudomycoides]|uniref:Uncharacterized protein n=1 Tax=Bacillus pseudomycoides TaxID=64104 RepID=A0AAJ2DL21_9BACI|nr:hypothetical protein [Bacillus pseudomycoides]MBD5797722.1 hypothetical protein [Bacillus pseudomycoides]MCR8857967.1 hypothetical protein [Bacillus pseudomycoides]MDR4326246.1 hypothetical protein [Bacillus pseudomycoides]MED1477256.1 hypothetical protein [Bacillus pseudomycoides]MED1534045.1 hypothetical protein [Bacillus pseudomycoides]